MKHTFALLSTLLIGSAVALTACGEPAPQQIGLAQEVNPFIGTSGGGNVYPGASAPFGMVQLSPDNGRSGWYRIAGYHYPDTTIAGFSHTHLSGTGAGDMYDISFMPAVPPFKTVPGELGVYSTFSHDDESAQAGYYQVFLPDYGVNVELVASDRCGLQRYTFPQTAQATVFLNLARAMNWDTSLGSEIRVVDNRTIEGYRYSTGWAREQRVYFVARFSAPFTDHAIEELEQRQRDTTLAPIRNQNARFVFDTRTVREVVVSTAISAVSMEGARQNLQAELPRPDFDSVRRAQGDLWNRALGKIQITGGTQAQRTTFYTALYRTMLAPVLFSDANGAYFGPDAQVHSTGGAWKNYSTFSLWDTYRAAHPLYTFIESERVGDMIEAMLSFYDQHGMLPVWPLWGNETDMMIGYHAVPVIAEAYLKGLIPDAGQAQRALAACVATANRDGYRAIGSYKTLGYVPADKEGESLSKTLEYAYDDYCIAQMARAMGRDEVYNEFIVRSKNYMNVFQPASGFMQPRLSSGEWVRGFDPKAYTQHITESNGWQYLWSVQHDIEGLVQLMRGPERFEQRLDEMFNLRPQPGDSLPIFSTGMIGQYAHGNEPSHHVAYLYNYIGRPEKTQELVGRIRREMYTHTPEGLCGNEDCGQMSAWYVFSALGFYPVDPVSLNYAIGTPLFDQAVIHLSAEKTFTVRAIGLDPARTGQRIERMNLNGRPLTSPFLSWRDIAGGGTLEFTMAK